MTLVKPYRLFPTSDVIESTNLAAVSPATVAATATNAALVFAIGGVRDEAGSSRRVLVGVAAMYGPTCPVSGQSQDVGFSVALPCSCRSP